MALVLYVLMQRWDDGGVLLASFMTGDTLTISDFHPQCIHIPRCDLCSYPEAGGAFVDDSSVSLEKGLGHDKDGFRYRVPPAKSHIEGLLSSLWCY